MVTPEFWLDALLNPAAVVELNGASDAQLGKYGVRRYGSRSFSVGTVCFTLSGSTQGSSHIYESKLSYLTVKLSPSITVLNIFDSLDLL